MTFGIPSYGAFLFLNQSFRGFFIKAHTGEVVLEVEVSKPKANVHFDYKYFLILGFFLP